MTGFVQIIEFKTSRISEIQEAVAEMRSELGTSGGALRGTVTADSARPGYYLNIVEFESRESAMENSARPEIAQFASRMAALCDEGPRYYNLDVVETWESESGGPSMKTVVAGAATAAAGVAAVAAAKSKSGDESEESETYAVDYSEAAPVISDTAVEEPAPVVVTSAEAADYPETQGRPI